MSDSSDGRMGKPAHAPKLDDATAALRADVTELLANPPPDVARVTTLLDGVVAPTFDPNATERLIQFVDADRPAAPAIVALGLTKHAGLAATFFPHRFALGLVAHSSPPQVPIDDLAPPVLRFGCVPDHYQRVMRRVKAVRTILSVMDDRRALTVMDLSEAQLGRVLQARALTESLAYDDKLGKDILAIFIEELVMILMAEAMMLRGFLNVATDPIQREGRLRLGTVVPETIEAALRAQPRAKLGASELFRVGPPDAIPQFFVDRWIDGNFAATARGVSEYMQGLAAAA